VESSLPSVTIAQRSPLPLTGVGMRKRAAFYTQLARQLDAGIGVVRSLRTLAGQGGSRRLAHAAAAMADHVEAGNRLSAAFAQHPNVFPPNEVRMIEGLEHAGREPEAMLRIARLLDRLALARARVIAGMIYPAVMLWAAFCLLPLVLAYVFGGPEAATRALLGQLRALAIGVGAWLALGMLFRSIPRHSALRVATHAAALVVPLLGKLFRRLALTRFADTFQALYVAGVTAPEAMSRAALACGNDFIGSRILRVAPLVADGALVSAALARSGVIPTLDLNLIEVGEQGGKLDAALAKFAQYEQEDLEIGIERLARILPTAAILLMVTILGAMVLAQWGAHFGAIERIMGR